MPAQPSIRSQSFKADQPVAEEPRGLKRPVARYFPGRNVSVLFGPSSLAIQTVSETRARIVLLLEIAGIRGAVGPLPLCCVGTVQVQLPAAVVLAAGEPEIAVASTNEQTVTLFIEPRFLRETVSSSVTGVTVANLAELSREDELIVPLTYAFRQLSRGEQHRNTQYVEALGIVTAAHVLNYFFDAQADTDRGGGLPIEAEQRVVAYIDDHYAEEFDVDALARASGFSRNHFQRLFKKSFNQTPRDYIRGCQVQHAITLLQTTSLKGMDVALACGFCDETQMARWFVKLRGCLPSQVREATRW